MNDPIVECVLAGSSDALGRQAFSQSRRRFLAVIMH